MRILRSWIESNVLRHHANSEGDHCYLDNFTSFLNPISLRGVSRKHTSYIIDSHVKMSEVNGFFFLDFAN